MPNWLLQTLSDVLNEEYKLQDNCQVVQPNRSLAEIKSQREWFSAIAAAENLLQKTLDRDCPPEHNLQGLVFSSPVPVFSDLSLISHLQTGVFTPEAFEFKALMPGGKQEQAANQQCLANSPIWKLPLIPNDPIIQEQFCLILTNTFALIMVLGKDEQGVSNFYFSFAPLTINKVWQTLRARLAVVNHPHLKELDKLVATFTLNCPDYNLVSQFSRQLLVNLPNLASFAINSNSYSENLHAEHRSVENVSVVEAASEPRNYVGTKLPHPNSELEMELLQALTHEIRTPLTTIRTLTKLLLKKKQELSSKVTQRLQAIENECTEQIERMELIFRATELESSPIKDNPVQLTSVCLETVLEQTVPRWQHQAQRRNVKIDVVVPDHLPEIVSDPDMLDRALTGLMESCTRSLSTGGKIRVSVATAGDRLKLQVISNANNNPFKSLGQLLMFQPETGCLSLNLDVTKNIFHNLGGKLTVRQKSKEGRELTIFLPLGKRINNLG